MVHFDYYTEAIHGKHEYLDLGHYEFEMGASLPDAKLAYKTHGQLNASKNSAILFSHMYSGTPHAMERFIGEPQHKCRAGLRKSQASLDCGSSKRQQPHRPSGVRDRPTTAL
jgi:hypothetical protein